MLIHARGTQWPLIEPMTFALPPPQPHVWWQSHQLETQSSLQSQFLISPLRETEEKRLGLYLLTLKSANNSCTPDLWKHTRAFVSPARL